MAFSLYHTDIRKTSKSYKKSNVKKHVYGADLDDKKNVYIPTFFILDIKYFLKENYLVMTDKDENINIYITPLIRTLLEDIKINVNKDDSLSRTIKERVNANARTLVKKSAANSKIVLIKDKQYIRLNANFRHIEGSLYKIMNDWQYENKVL